MVDQPNDAHLPLAGTVAVGRADWERAAGSVLVKAGRSGAVDDLLASHTLDGLPVPALAPARTGPPDPGIEPYTRGTAQVASAGGWDVRARVVDPDAAKAATTVLEELANGATSLWITLGGNGTRLEDLPLVLDEVYFDLAPVVVQASGEVTALQAAWALADLLPRAAGPHRSSNLGADPVGQAIRARRPAEMADLPAVADLALRLGVRAAVVDATAAHQEGAAEVGELGYSLALGISYLRTLTDAGMPVEQAFSLLEFRYAATAEPFVTTAKLRAARRLWHRVAELSGVGGPGAAQAQHAVTSWPMLTRYDPWTNLLRNTVAAFGAGIGGAAAVTVLPFDAALGIPEALGRRLARNTSSLLLAESQVAAATDPAGGSHAVEQLTTELATAAWAEFQRIEQSGGILAALTQGSVQSRWAGADEERRRQEHTRRRQYTGVTDFPANREKLLQRRPFEVPEPTGWAVEFEAMRDEAPSGSVFLATLGEVADHSARAAFARNTFAAGGIDTVVAGGNASVKEMLVRYDGSPVVCLVGTDAAYDADGPAAIWSLRTNGARWVILAGSPAPELALLVDDHLAIGTDVVAFLQRTTAQLAEGSWG